MHHVNASGGVTVTWVSGAKFTSLRAGMFIRLGPSASPTEAQILSVNSATSLTLYSPVPTLTNVAAQTGQADMINIDSCAYNIISENTMFGGMSGGIVLHNSKGSTSTIATIVVNNSCTSIGNMGISIQTPNAATFVDSTIIKGNVCGNCGTGGAANLTNSAAGIWIDGAQATNTLVAGNICNGQGGGNQLWGIRVDPSVPAGQTTITGNVSINNVTGDVFGGGWLAYTPSVSANTGTLTTVSPTGRYRLIDKTVQFQATIRIVTNGTAAGTVIVGLPLAASGVAFAIYSISGRAGAISGKGLSGSIQPAATTVAVVNVDNTYPGASGEVLAISGTYEVA